MLNYKDGWYELKDYLKNGITYLDELAYKYVSVGNGEEFQRIDTKRTEYKNFYRKMDEIESVIGE